MPLKTVKQKCGLPQKTARSKHAPVGRKFAQSGHPARNSEFIYQGCQIFLVQHTKTGKIYQNGENIPNDHQIYQMAIKWLEN
jgi:hypothetical protein